MPKQVNQTTRAFIVTGVLVFILWITFTAMARGRDKLYSRAGSEDTLVADQCVITNCHGLTITCGPQEPAMCTMMYGFGDRCREHARCSVIDGTCRPITNDAFEACVSCVRDCEVAHPNDMPEAFACEGRCSS